MGDSSAFPDRVIGSSDRAACWSVSFWLCVVSLPSHVTRTQTFAHEVLRLSVATLKRVGGGAINRNVHSCTQSLRMGRGAGKGGDAGQWMRKQQLGLTGGVDIAKTITMEVSHRPIMIVPLVRFTYRTSHAGDKARQPQRQKNSRVWDGICTACTGASPERSVHIRSMCARPAGRSRSTRFKTCLVRVPVSPHYL